MKRNIKKLDSRIKKLESERENREKMLDLVLEQLAKRKR